MKAQPLLQRKIIALGYAPHIDDDHWQVEPDCKVGAPHEILTELVEIFAQIP